MKVLISSTIRSIPSGLLKSAIGIPWRTTLCYSSSFWAVKKGYIYSQIERFSRRKSAEKESVVVTTIFWLRVLETVATTGPFTPLFIKALLKAFLKTREENLV